MEQLLPLYRVLYKFNQFDVDTVMREALFYDKEFTDKMIELNTIEQLYKKGIDSTGDSIGEYQPATIEGTSRFKGKIEKGQPYDRVTLKDTGDFYNSFRIYIDSNFDLIVKADTIKEGIDLLDQWGKDILGLTDESLVVLRDMAKEKTINYLHRKLAA